MADSQDSLAPFVQFIDRARGSMFPPSPKKGQVYFHTTEVRHFVFDGQTWKPQRAEKEPRSYRWYSILSTKTEEVQKATIPFIMLPFTAGKFLDIVRGTEFPKSGLYVGRVFFRTDEGKHFSLQFDPHAPVTTPQWVALNDDPEPQSTARYERIEALSEDDQIRIYIVMWQNGLIQEGQFKREMTWAQPILSPPVTPRVRSAEEKALLKAAADVAAANARAAASPEVSSSAPLPAPPSASNTGSGT